MFSISDSIAIVTLISGLLLAWLGARAGKASTPSKIPAPSDISAAADHAFFIQARLTELVSGVTQLAPTFAALGVRLDRVSDDLREGVSEIMDRLEKTHEVSERTMTSGERVERSHAAYIANSSQALQSIEGNTRILGQTMGQVRDEVMGVRSYVRTLVDRKD